VIRDAGVAAGGRGRLRERAPGPGLADVRVRSGKSMTRISVAPMMPWADRVASASSPDKV